MGDGGRQLTGERVMGKGQLTGERVTGKGQLSGERSQGRDSLTREPDLWQVREQDGQTPEGGPSGDLGSRLPGSCLRTGGSCRDPQSPPR